MIMTKRSDGILEHLDRVSSERDPNTSALPPSNATAADEIVSLHYKLKCFRYFDRTFYFDRDASRWDISDSANDCRTFERDQSCFQHPPPSRKTFLFHWGEPRTAGEICEQTLENFTHKVSKILSFADFGRTTTEKLRRRARNIVSRRRPDTGPLKSPALCDLTGARASVCALVHNCAYSFFGTRKKWPPLWSDGQFREETPSQQNASTGIFPCRLGASGVPTAGLSTTTNGRGALAPTAAALLHLGGRNSDEFIQRSIWVAASAFRAFSRSSFCSGPGRRREALSRTSLANEARRSVRVMDCLNLRRCMTQTRRYGS